MYNESWFRLVSPDKTLIILDHKLMRFFFFSPVTTIIEIYRSFACVHIPHLNCADTVSFAFVALWCDESWSHLVSVDKRLTIFAHNILRFFSFPHSSQLLKSVTRVHSPHSTNADTISFAFIMFYRFVMQRKVILPRFCWQSINHTRPWGIAVFSFLQSPQILKTIDQMREFILRAFQLRRCFLFCFCRFVVRWKLISPGFS